MVSPMSNLEQAKARVAALLMLQSFGTLLNNCCEIANMKDDDSPMQVAKQFAALLDRVIKEHEQAERIRKES